MKWKRSVFVALPVLCLLGAASGPVTVTAENVQTFYRSYARLTERPLEVSPLLSALCTSFSPEHYKREEERAGPHARAFAHVYVGGVAASELGKEEREFPVGTVVVKEKLGADLSVVGIGGMQKMSPGYDAEGGDWKYFYSSRTSAFSSGRLETCRSCHARAKSSDFVYFIAKAHP